MFDIFEPFVINVFLELTWISLAIGLDDALERLRIVFVDDFTIFLLEQVWLKLKSSWQFVVDDNLPDF
jgi:hypothetical protein